ncbi:MAG: GatB/YqeY domain-containing protein [Chryseolinea sp.]
MSLKQQIDNDIKKAMLAKQKEELEALRSIKSLILIAETDKGAVEEISSEKENKMLVTAAKQRRESADIFIQQNRQDLADKELFQLDVIRRYLPKQLSETDLENAVKVIIAQVNAQGIQDLGKVMGVATKSLSGQADGKQISEQVKRLLSI